MKRRRADQANEEWQPRDDAVHRPPDTEEAEEAVSRRRFRVLLGLLAAAAVTLVLLIGLMGLWWTSLSGRLEMARRTPPALPPVAVLPARAEHWPRSLDLPATLQPRVAERVTAPAAGRVYRIMVRPGERVEAGQVVAQIAAPGRFAGSPGALAGRTPASRRPVASGVTSRERAQARARQRLAQAQQASHTANLALAAARAARAQTAAQRDVLARQADDAEQRFARVAARSKRSEVASRPADTFYIAGSDWRPGLDSNRPFPGVVQRHPDRLITAAHDARAEATSARTAVARADDAVRAARQQCEQAEAALAAAQKATLSQNGVPSPSVSPSLPPGHPTLVEARAASAGVVAGVAAASGVRIAPGGTLLRLARSTAAEYRMEGPVSDFLGVRVGMPARIHAGGVTLPARVRAVRAVAGGRRLVDVAAVGIPAPRVDGTEVRVELVLPPANPALCVPAPAVVRTAEGATIWIAQRDAAVPSTWTAHRRLVRLGAMRGNKVEVRAGLDAGQRVIVAGMEHLRDGQPVAAVPWNLP